MCIISRSETFGLVCKDQYCEKRFHSFGLGAARASAKVTGKHKQLSSRACSSICSRAPIFTCLPFRLAFQGFSKVLSYFLFVLFCLSGGPVTAGNCSIHCARKMEEYLPLCILGDYHVSLNFMLNCC